MEKPVYSFTFLACFKISACFTESLLWQETRQRGNSDVTASETKLCSWFHSIMLRGTIMSENKDARQCLKEETFRVFLAAIF